MSTMGGGNELAYDLRERLALLAAALASLVVELDWLAVNVALPEIAASLHRSPTDLQWLISAFTLAFGGVMPAAGWVVDAFGRRRTTICALLLFLVSSLVCACAGSLPLLIAGRALQGAAGSFVVPGAIAMTAGGFTGRKRDVGLGAVMATASGGAALAPFVGGLLVDWFGWRSVFFLNVPVVVASIALTCRYVTPSGKPATAAARRPPFLNGACAMGGAIALAVGADRGSTWGWTSAATVLCGVGGVGLLAGFALLERDESRAMFSPELRRDRRLHVLTLGGAGSVIGFVVLSTFTVLYLQDGRGLTAFVTGSLLLCFSLPNAVAAYAAGHLVGRRSVNALVTGALAVAAIGLVTLTVVPFPGLYVLALTVCGVGFGLSGALTSILTQQRASPHDAGTVASATLAFKYLGAAVAVSVAATVLEALHHGVGGAAADSGNIDTILRATAALPAVGVILTAPAALARRHRRPT